MNKQTDATPATKSTQRLRIMQHLRKYGTLTSLEAITLYGIMRLSSRISELKARGERIETVMRKGMNKYGEPVRYAEYHLREENPCQN